MSESGNPAAKSPVSHLHVMNLVVALLAGIISITGGIYSLKNNLFSGPGYGSLQGIVRDERIAKPLYLTSVELSGIDGAVVNTVTTDADGHYLMETLKEGNYVVKFTAPRHSIQTKNLKIERNLKSSINIDLVPEEEPVKTLPAVSEVSPKMNPATAYPAAYTGSNTSAPSPQNPAAGYQSPYGQAPDAAVSTPPATGGYRRHSRRSYSSNPYGTSGVDATQTSSTSNQSSALVQVGTQLVQGLIAKKSENS